MGDMTTTYTNTDTGKPVEPDTIEAWETTAEMAREAAEPLQNFPAGLVPDVLRFEFDKAVRTVQQLRSTAHGIAVETRRYERAGRERDDALATALADARLTRKIKGGG